MSIFSRLFGKSATTIQAENMPAENLFIEPQAPADALINAALYPDGKEAPPAAGTRGFVYTRPSEIRAFLEKDYREMGEKDALLNPTAEMRNLKLEGISKRFRFTLQHVQEQLAAQLAKLEQELLLMGELSPIVSGKLKLRMQELHAMADKLDRQTELSLDGEGWIAPVLTDYKEGFLAGVMRYQREMEMLEGINILC